MSKLVRAGILALAMVSQSSNVRAITLRTLLENQVAAGSTTQADAESKLQQAAVLNLAREIEELSFAQVKQETGANEQPQQDPDPFDVEQGFVELAKQLVELSGTGKLGTLRECLIDVANGTYETSVAAKLAAGTLQQNLGDDGMQNVDVLVKKTDNLLQPGQSITGMDGATVSVDPVMTDPPADQTAALEDGTGGDGNPDESNEQQPQGDSTASSDNTEADSANADANLQVDNADANTTTDGATNTGGDAQPPAVADEPDERPDDDDDGSWFSGWM